MRTGKGLEQQGPEQQQLLVLAAHLKVCRPDVFIKASQALQHGVTDCKEVVICPNRGTILLQINVRHQLRRLLQGKHHRT